MTIITTDLIKQLRDETGVSVMQCKKALEEMAGDYEKAKIFLRKKSAADALKKGDRAFGASCSAAYIHQGGKVGVLVQMSCETDFVAQNPEFIELANNIAIHVAGLSPEIVRESEITEEVKTKYINFFKEESAKSGKPENIQEKMVEGKWAEFLAGSVLLNQKYLKDDSKTIQELINGAIQKFGENITVAKFVRYS